MSSKKTGVDMAMSLERFANNRQANHGTGSLHGMVVQRLGYMITTGQFKAREVLPSAEELCQRLGVGRSVLREGLKVLSQKGF